MYETYWQLDRKPFEPTVDGPNYYPSETHQGAMLKLRYAVESRRGAALLVGPSGCGKTLLVQLLKKQLKENFSPFVHVVFPQMSVGELLHYVADELGAPGATVAPPTIDESVRRIHALLEENAAAGRHAVLAIDEAHLLAGGNALETLRLLLNFEIGARPGLMLLVVGQPPLLSALSRLPSLDDRLGVKILLRPFTLEETVSYVNHALAGAGASRAIFDATALEALHYLTHGIPRQINRLCDLALLIGYAEELPVLSASHIESVSEELVTIAPE